jgi:hypothetical protein
VVGSEPKAAGLFVMRNRAAAQKPFRYWVLIILPVLVLITTPPFMYLKQHGEWLTEGRLPMLIIYKGLALLQTAIAVPRAIPLGGSFSVRS